MGNKSEITFDDLLNFTTDNQLAHYDPARESFKLFDPHGTGSVDFEILGTFFRLLGYDELTPEHIDIIRQATDLDSDGNIGLDDFRTLVPSVRRRSISPKLGRRRRSMR